MALGNRTPLDAELRQAGLQSEAHGPMIADDGVRRAPPRDGLAKDVAQPREVLPVEAARPDDRPTVAVEDQAAVEPVPVDLDEIPQIGLPNLVRRGGQSGTCIGVGETPGPRGHGMGFFIKGHHLPDGGVAIAIAQGV